MKNTPSVQCNSPWRGYTFGVVAGFGGGLLIATVLYKYSSVASLNDPLRLLGFSLLFGGSFLARRGRKSARLPSPEA